ncbi:hypothetical protein BMS3Abin03_01215 [bacterium BMS3Abin03]|nr:hypothetical protein BMS3Abin03_01215 [bacterium BMS3Abin03]
MKKVTAYVNTIRVHWLVHELQKIGIDEIMVTEYFKPKSQISRLELKCGNIWVDQVRKIIHDVGTTGIACDHYFEVTDLHPDDKSIFPDLYG